MPKREVHSNSKEKLKKVLNFESLNNENDKNDANAITCIGVLYDEAIKINSNHKYAI